MISCQVVTLRRYMVLPHIQRCLLLCMQSNRLTVVSRWPVNSNKKTVVYRLCTTIDCSINMAMTNILESIILAQQPTKGSIEVVHVHSMTPLPYERSSAVLAHIDIIRSWVSILSAPSLPEQTKACADSIIYQFLTSVIC